MTVHSRKLAQAKADFLKAGVNAANSRREP
jgi:hypothetical protein